MFTDAELKQIIQKGLSQKTAEEQIAFFKKGIDFLNVDKPATPGDGIEIPGNLEIEDYVKIYESDLSNKKVVKFVPASGAASRMFKSLFEYISAVDKTLPKDVNQVIDRIKEFAFYPDLEQKIQRTGLNIGELLKNEEYQAIIQYILEEKGLNYGNLPKGLLKFHRYPELNRTSVEEHLVEGALYAKNSDNQVFIHFTVSPEHLQLFKDLVDSVCPAYEHKFNVKYSISFSIQKPSTDTIAVDDKNNPFLENSGKILFRPGGHGALLENLNDLDGDIIFIKNIDNVVPDKIKDTTINYKKALAGLLVKLQNQVFQYLLKLENECLENDIAKIETFIQDHLGYCFSDSYLKSNRKDKSDLLVKILNRPIRICGMVKNEGEPGGGPYWVKSSDGSSSLQILESSQFNMSDTAQKDIFNKATHFNPVDLVIATKDYKGQKFNLLTYRDPDTGFISVKSKDGKALKALELPGLWNGSMAFWNTIFVEVPMITFNPVKTINDLLRKEHQ